MRFGKYETNLGETFCFFCVDKRRRKHAESLWFFLRQERTNKRDLTRVSASLVGTREEKRILDPRFREDDRKTSNNKVVLNVARTIYETTIS